MKTIKNKDRMWFQFWKPKTLTVGLVTSFMVDLFERPDIKNADIFRDMFSRNINTDYRRWKPWKKKYLSESDFKDSNETVSIDIIRGDKKING